MNSDESMALPDAALAEEAARAESDREDQGLVQSTLAGDSTAFDRLYRKYREQVLGVIYRVLRNREDSLEGVQEVFTKVYRALPSYRPDYRFFTWLYRIALNQAIDQLRRRRVRKEQLYDQEFTLPRSDQPQHHRFSDPARELDRREVGERIEAALASLPEKHRQVFVLFSYESINYADIAELLEIPIGTVMSRLFYARKKLKECLPTDWDPGGRRRRADE